MKTRILILFILLFPAFIFAQPSFKALIDTSADCYPSRGHFFIVEEMPSPNQTLNEIENMLNQKVQFAEKELGVDGKIYIQFLVNCKGEPGDYQLTQCPDTLISVCNQIIEVFRNESIKWNPGRQRGETVDVFLQSQIEIKKGNLEIIVFEID